MDRGREVVERALSYPYAVPPRSFGLAAGRLVEYAEIAADLSTRVPLLVYGSNASPDVLARKLGPATDPVPVARVSLRDLDVVYSAHIAAYGSVPATLRRSPGTEAPAFVAYLTDEQLRLVAATEPNYELRRLPDLFYRREDGEAETGAVVYLSRHGCLLIDGAEVALGAVSARGRRFASMGERQVLEHVRDVLRPGEDLERFILDCASGTIPDTSALDRCEAP